MDKCRDLNFEKAVLVLHKDWTQEDLDNCWNGQNYGATTVSLYFWGWQSRQAEVDSLKKQIEALYIEQERLQELNQGYFYQIQGRQQTIDEYQDEIKEKDKRIENLISKWRTDAEQASKKSSEDWAENILNYCADDLEKALRGNET